MTDQMQVDAALEAELADHLARAGIVLPPGRLPEVLREYRILKQQIETVRTAVPAESEPAVIFVPS